MEIIKVIALERIRNKLLRISNFINFCRDEIKRIKDIVDSNKTITVVIAQTNIASFE
jgi:hypothetical protein